MRYDPVRHHRRSIRLRGYNYAEPGEYYVTLCVKDQVCALGEIKDGSMQLSSVGEIAKQCWDEIPDHFENVELGDYIIMPNHVHGVILLRDIPRRDGVTRRDEVTSSLREVSGTEPQQSMIKRSPTLGQVVAFHKYRSTKLINAIRDAPGKRFWQRNYYEHIIRDANDLVRIRKYIANNVSKWSEDNEDPMAETRCVLCDH